MPRAENSEHWPLIQGQQWDVLEAILTDPAFLDAKVASGHVFALVEDFAAALAALPADRPGRRLVELLGRAVRRDAGFLARHRNALFQCLWNTGWWHDHVTGGELSTLLEGWRKTKEQRQPGFVWVRSLRPPIVPLDNPLLAVLPGPFSFNRPSVAFSADGERVAVFFAPAEGEPSREPLLWDVLTGQPLPLAAGSLPTIRPPGHSPDGRLRAVPGSWDDPVRLIDVASGQEIHGLDTGGDVVLCDVAFSPDGRRLVGSGYGDEYIGALLMWNVIDGRRLINDFRGDTVWTVAFSPDGTRLACGMSNGVEIRDATTGATLQTLPGHETPVSSMAFSPDGRLLASVGRDATVRLWNLARPTPAPAQQPHPDHVCDLTFSTDGARLVSRSTNDTTWLWDGRTGSPVACLHSSQGVVMMGGSASGSIFADQRRVVSVAHTGGIWNAVTGASLGAIPENRRFLSSFTVAFSPRNDRLAVTLGHGSHRISLLDTTNWDRLRDLDGHHDDVRLLSFSPDGRSLVSAASDGSVRVWSVDSDVPSASLDGHTAFVTDVAFSADGTRVVSAAVDRTIRIWDARTGAQLACLEPPDIGEWGRSTSWSEGQKTREEIFYGAADVAFTPDGESVVTLTDGDRLRWWNWRTGECWRTVRGVGDFRAIAADLPWRALVRDGEVVIETSNGEPVAWFPCAPAMRFGQRAAGLGLTTHPGGRIWAGSVDRHLYHFALEGK
jgi:WD40 repeat protein